MSRWLASLALLVSLSAHAQVGVIGDSFSDEYRADDNRGGSYAATTLQITAQ